MTVGRLICAAILAGLVLASAGCGRNAGGAVGSRPPHGLAPVTGAAVEITRDPPAPPALQPRGRIELMPLGSYRHGNGVATSAAEISAYDAATKRLFVVNVEKRAIDVLDIADPSAPQFVAALDVSHVGTPTSVAAKNGMIAATVAAKSKRNVGKVVFLTAEGELIKALDVGHEPDMLTFSPDGHWLLTANEGEPENDYSFDPEGSVSQIDVSGGVEGVSQESVATLDFQTFNAQRATLDQSIRIYGKNASVAQDLEPEYIAVSPDSKTAWIACQENNAIAVADLEAKKITRLVGLGFKDHSLAGNGIDASDKDKAIRIRPWPVKGMYQPDGMAAFAIDGKTYLITANDGKDRDYPGFNEQCRVADLKLDPKFFPNAAELQKPKNLGRLRTTKATGDYNGDGLFEEIFSYGGRSFSIWTESVEQVFDSGDQFERIVAAQYPEHFNADHESHEFDNRSDNKGPEPEGVAVGLIDGKTFAFIGLERMGGVMVYDVSEPASPAFESYVNTRDFSQPVGAGTGGDLGPEGMLFIPAADSPIGSPLFVVSYEVSGTTRIFRISTRGTHGEGVTP